MKELNKSKLEAAIRNNMKNDIARGNIGGAAAIVAQHGKIICDIREGYKNVETKEPLTPHTFFRLASMTKPITGIACMIAVQNGWFKLDDKVADYFPAVADMYVGKVDGDKVVPDHKPKTELRMFQMLNHNSGFMSERDLIGELQTNAMPYSAYASNHAMVDYVTHHTYLCFEPGEEAGYSAYAAFDIIGCIIEEKSGMPYADFLKKNIFEPLGITDITYNPTEEQWSRMITMCDKVDEGVMKNVEMGRYTFENFPPEYSCGGAGLAGTIEDYLKIAEMLRCGGEYNGVRILEKESVELMSKPYVNIHIPGMNDQDSWGLGVRVTVENNILPAGCFGWSGAYGTHFWVDPENDLVALYLKNTRFYDSHGGGQTSLDFEQAVVDALE